MRYAYKFFFFLLLTACSLGLVLATDAYAAKPSQPVPFAGPTSVAIAPFDTLVAQGRVNITLVRSNFVRGIEVLGSPEQAKALKVEQKGSTLFLSNSMMAAFASPASQTLDIIVPVANLKTFTVTLRGVSQLLMGSVKMNTLNIRTFDNAHAQVNATTWLNAIALNRSSIYYTGKPRHVNVQSFNAATIVPLKLSPYY